LSTTAGKRRKWKAEKHETIGRKITNRREGHLQRKIRKNAIKKQEK